MSTSYLLDVDGIRQDHGQSVDSHAPASSGWKSVLQSCAERLVNEHSLIITLTQQSTDSLSPVTTTRVTQITNQTSPRSCTLREKICMGQMLQDCAHACLSSMNWSAGPHWQGVDVVDVQFGRKHGCRRFELAVLRSESPPAALHRLHSVNRIKPTPQQHEC